MTLLFLGGLAAVYLYQEQRLQTTKGDYEALIASMEAQKVKGFVLTKNCVQGEILTSNHFEERLIDSAQMPKDAVVTREQVEGMTLKTDLSERQVLSLSLIYNAQEIPDGLRDYETSAILVPSQLKALNHVDIRINFPSGLDYIVLTKKCIDHLQVVEDSRGLSTFIRFKMDSDELLRLSSAMVDAFLNKGTYLYAIPYVDAGAQKAAMVNYPVNPDVRQLILTDPNITTRAQLALDQANRTALTASLGAQGLIEVRLPPQSALPEGVGNEEPAKTEDSEMDTAADLTSDVLQ